jgi:hypothetical protein
MLRTRLALFVLAAAFGLTVGCSSMPRLNLFNKNKCDTCTDVGTGPVCDGPVMGSSGRPVDSTIVMPPDAGFGHGMMLPGTAPETFLPSAPTMTNPGAFPQGTLQPNTAQPPAAGQPGRLQPIPPQAPKPAAPFGQ